MTWIALYWVLTAPPDPADLEFARLQEVWACEASPPQPELPPVVRAFGSRKWVARDASSAFLRARGPRYLPTLVKACRDRDPEVRHRAEQLINRLFRCSSCGGGGLCRFCVNGRDEPGTVAGAIT